MPASMQSSFDSDLLSGGVNSNGNFMLQNVIQENNANQTMIHNLQHQQSHISKQTSPNPNVNGLINGYTQNISNGNGNGNSLNNLMATSGVLNNGMNGQLNQGINGINNTLNGGLNGLSNVLNNAFEKTNTNGANVAGPGPFSSMLEYNLSRLASLTESNPDTITDALVPTNNAQLQGVSNVTAQNPTITLADILSGDQRAFNNLQALAKIGLNGNDVAFNTEMSSNNFLQNGNSTNELDCFLSDFCLPPTTPSPGLTSGLGAVDDMALANFHANSTGNNTNIATGRSKATPMQIRCKFGSLGTSKGQFNSPHGFCLGVDEEIIVADTNNHRIEVFDKSGTLKFQFGVPGKEEGQLWYPRKVAVMPTNGKFVVCDRGNERSRMQIFSKCGHFMRKIAIRYIDIVAGLAVTSKGHIVAVDSVSPTVFVISEDGELVRWFDCSDYMREPSDIAIRDHDFYVCDFKGHCVAVFQEDGTFQYRIGNEKVTCFPNGIDISNAGDILIGDSHGNRFHVAVYSRDGKLQSEFECPHVKVSRCCGLKITSEGYVVTLAKNNHHVLVLNTLSVH